MSCARTDCPSRGPLIEGLTRHRRAVLELLRSGQVHVTAQEIYDGLRPTSPDMALATVYRSLHALQGLGLVKAVETGSGATRYEAVRQAHPHIVCLDCGHVSDLSFAEPEELDRLAQEATAYRVLGHEIVFEGYCPNCRGQHEQAKQKGETENGA